jgi:hypothetical protein
MSTSTYTLRFPSRTAAVSAAKALGFWDTSLDRLKTDGQSQAPDGSWYGWSIAEVGKNLSDPSDTGYYCNIVGQLPPEAMAYLAPEGYGAAGVRFA